DLTTPYGPRIRPSALGSPTKHLLGRRCPTQYRFGPPRSPRDMCDASKCDADVLHDTTSNIDCHGNRDKCERVRRAVTNLAVVRVSCKCEWRQVDGSDQLAVLKHGIALRFFAGEAVEAGKWDGPFAVRPQHAHDGIQRNQCNGHVRWMGCNACLRCSEDCQVAVIALARGTTTARVTLIAGLRDILEVDATRTLQQIPAGRGQVG